MFPSSSTNSDHSDSRLSDAVYDIYLKLLSTLQGYQWRLHNDHRAPRVRPEPREPARSPSNPQGSRTQRITSILSFCGSRLPDAAYGIYFKLLRALRVPLHAPPPLPSSPRPVGECRSSRPPLFSRSSARFDPRPRRAHRRLQHPPPRSIRGGTRRLEVPDIPPSFVRPAPSFRAFRCPHFRAHPGIDEDAPRDHGGLLCHQRSLYRAQIASFVAHRQTQPYAREGKGDIYLVASVLNSDIRDFRRHRITGAALLEKVAFKGGHTKRMARRQMEYGKCEGRRRTLIWICHYTVQRRYYCERLFHLRLFERGGVRDVHKCTCKVAHREFLTFPTFPSISGLAQGHATMKSVLRAMGRRPPPAGAPQGAPWGYAESWTFSDTFLILGKSLFQYG
ncbi:hypothetical protein B0H11DRAFT_1912728 [Mycena galericulata]|nr:hypothetical protein B0H11DRAFT_1912723 [Mycena galericulata]KAJ7489731.1 hypothetical protein B0H11DRAFT_1912728 [Mycena galericulata]